MGGRTLSPEFIMIIPEFIMIILEFIITIQHHKGTSTVLLEIIDLVHLNIAGINIVWITTVMEMETSSCTLIRDRDTICITINTLITVDRDIGEEVTFLKIRR